MNWSFYKTHTMRLSTITLILFFLCSLNTKAQNFIWGQQLGSSSYDIGSDIDTDSSGNTVVVGTFFATTTIDSITLTSAGAADGFIAKLNQSGDAIWAIRVGGSSSDNILSVDVDQNTGEIYVVGTYFAAFAIAGTTLPYTGFGSDAFLLKLSPSGVPQWVKAFTGTYGNSASDVAVDEENGYVYASGSFDSTIVIGSTTLNATGFSTSIYLTRFSTSGGFEWAQKFQANDVYASGFGTKAGGLKVLSDGDVAIAGNYRGSLSVGSITLTATGGNNFTYDGYIARIDSSGTALWAKTMGGVSTDYANDVAVDTADNIWVTGRSSGTASFDTISLPSAGSSSAFIAKFNSTGSALYAYQTGGGSLNDGYGVDVDALGNVYLIGRYYSGITFGSIILTSTNTGSKLFIAKLNSLTNTWDWVIGPDYTGSFSPAEEGRAIAVDGEDDVYVTGVFSGTIKLANQTLVTQGSYDVFVSKIGDCSSLSSSIVASGPTNICSGETVTFSTDTSSVYEYQWLFNGASLPGQINPTYSASQGGDYRVIIDSLGCVDTSTIETVIVGITPTVTHNSLGAYCENDASVTLSGGSPTGGTYSGPGVSGGVFTPSVAGPGTHPIVYTYTNGDGCSDSISKNVSITASPFVFMLGQASVCEDDAPFALTSGIPSGGTYSGSGITGGVIFSPAAVGVGTHTVYYTRTNGLCSTTDSVDIIVNGVPNVNLNPLADVCISTVFTPLTGGSPGGGTYSGPGVSSPFFFPSAAGWGEHDLVYTVTLNGCSSSDTTSIGVDTVPNPIMAPLPVLCENDADLNLAPYVFPEGGVFSGPSVVDSVFSPFIFGAGSDSIVYTITNACGSDTAAREITVQAAPSVSLAPLSAVCIDAGVQSLSGGTPIGGSFSGSGVTGGTFNPQTAGVGTHPIKYIFTNANGCSDSATANIIVNPLPVVTLSAFADVCIDAGTQTLSGGLPTGGTFFGTAVTAGVFDPATAGAGTFSIGYAFTDANTCADTAYEDFIVNPLSTATLSAFADVCVDAGSQSLSGGLPVGGTYFGTGVSSGSFDPAIAGVGTHQIGYTYADANSCTDTAYQNIVVNPLPTVTLSAFTAVCIDAGTQTLTGGLPTGGTYFGTGVTTGVFDPAAAGAGTHQIGYTFVDGNACTDTAYQNFVVNPLPVVTLSAFADVCIDAGIQTLSGGLPAGGTYFGTAVTAGAFDPATAGAGTFSIGYAFTDANTCADTAYEDITVNPLPVVTLSAFAAVCVDAGSQTLSGGLPIGGTYFGTGVSSGSFGPATAGVGTHQIGYTYADANSCTDTAYQNIVVNPLPIVTLSAFTAVCIDAGSQTLSGGLPTGGTYFGTGVTAGVFDPATAGAGTHQIGYTFVDGNSCTDTAYQNFVVNPLPVVTLSAFADVCIDAGTQTLSGGLPTGGTFFGTAVTAGAFNPATAGAGTFSIGYAFTDGNSCADTAYEDITVNPLPVVTLSAFAAVCVDAGSQLLSGGLPTGGTYFGAGVSSGSFDPATAGVGTHQIGYTYADANSCTDTAYQNIVVNPFPTVTLSAFTAVCIDAGSQTLSGGLPTGGTYFGTGVTAGVFDPAAAGAGTHQIGYTFVDGNSCTDTAYQNFVVNPLPVVTLSAFADVCIDAGTQTLSGGLPAGGTYFGTAVTAGVFDPATAGAGTFSIGYAFTDANTCADTAYEDITVNPLPVVTLSAFADVCVDAGSQTLSGGLPIGGTYFGTGVSSGSFGPATAGVGTHQIGYTYADANSCTDTAYQNIVVNPLPIVTLSAFTAVCIDAGSQTLSGGLPTGGTYFGTGVTAGVFDPATAGAGTHQIGYTFVDGNACADTAYQNFVVNPLPVVTLSAFSDVCIDAGTQTLSGGLPAGGTYFGTAVTAGVFDPATAGAGTFSIGYAFTDANTCADTAYEDFIVNPLSTATLSAFADVCVDAGSQSLSGGLPVGGTYFGTGVSSGSFDPAIAGVGTHQIGYTYADANSCTDTAYQNIVVNPLPTVTLFAFTAVCIDAGTQTLTGGLPTGGTYFGTGVTTGVFDPATAGAGSHQIGYTFVDGNACTDTAYQNFVVNPLPVVSLSAFTDVCIDAGTQTLSGGLPAGGTYFGTAVTAGVFDPATAGAGTFSIGYAFTDGNTCADTSYEDITVNPLPVVTLSSFSAVCVDAGSQILTGGLPTGGTYFGTGVSAGNFDPATAGVGTHSIGYTFVDGNSCTDTAFQNITVNPLPTVTLSVFSAICIDAGSQTLSGGLPTGGTYFGTGVTAGVFDPAAAGAGTHQIGYTFVDGNACTDTAYQNLVVNPLPVVTLSAFADVCIDAGTQTLSGGLPAGGTYFGTAVTAGAFDPATAGAGTFSIGYTYADGNSCADTVYEDITVNPLPVVTLSSFAAACVDAGSQTLSGGLPTGGTYFGTGISSGSFDPATAGVGTHQIGYTYADANLCADTAYQNIIVNPLPTVTLSAFTAVCIDAGTQTLTGGLPTGGTYFGTGVTAGVFDPSTAGAGTHQIGYTFVDGNACTDTAYQNLVVNSLPIVSFSILDTICYSGAGVTLTNGSPSGGTYSGAGVSGNVFSPNIAGSGNHVITYSYFDVNGCSAQAEDSIHVRPQPIVSLPLVNDVCEDLDVFQIPTPSPLGGVFSSTGVLIGSDTFDVTNSGVGSFLIIYTYTDNNGCVKIENEQFSVNPLPVVSFDLPTDSVCEYTPVELIGQSPLGGLFSGPNVSNDTIYTTDLDYNQNITYTFTDANGCVNSAMDQLWVYPDPGIQFSEEPLQLCAGEVVSLEFANPIDGDFVSDFVSNGVLTAPDTAYTGLGGVYAFGNVCGFDQDTFYLSVTLNPEIDLGNDTLICEGTTLVLDAQSHESYVWDDFSSDSTYTVNAGELVSIGNQTISVTVFDSLGCSSSDAITVTVSEQPAFYIGDNIYSCLDSTIELSVQNVYDSFVWSTGDTGVSATAHDGSIIMPGVYSFWATGVNATGCSYTDSISLRLADCENEYVGIKETSDDLNELVVYPNPTRANLFVRWNEWRTEPLTEMLMYDMFGSLVKTIAIENSDSELIEISTSGLADGVYLLSVKTERANKTLRVLIQK
jgi:hypothetical protein